MFYSISTLSYDLIERQPVYDNPPVIVSAPRWARAARLAAAVHPHGSQNTQASTASPACACG